MSNPRMIMRTFQDENGHSWVASVRERPGPDYKGRYYFTMVPEDPDREDEGIDLLDVRWNTERTAQRTLETMSKVELRRRLRQARGRSRAAFDGPVLEPAPVGPGASGGSASPASPASDVPDAPDAPDAPDVE